METAAFDTDVTLATLTEALRRGPGSPEWHRAIADLRDSADPHADEYRLLITARERLESGRQYREVRAGPAFTRELFGRLGSATTDAPHRPSVALLIGLLCLLALVALIGAAVMNLVTSRTREPVTPFDGRLFVTPVRAWAFTGKLPNDLHAAGPLKLDVRGQGLRAIGRDTKLPAAGVLYGEDVLDLSAGTCLELLLDVRTGPTGVQLTLLQETPTDGSATSGGVELAIACDDAGVRFVSPAETTTPRSLRNGPHVLRLKAVGDVAVAEVDGQVLWTGRQPIRGHGFAAVRFVRKPGGGNETTVQSLRVLAP